MVRDIRSIGSDGRAVLEDGTEVQLCIGNAGELRARAVKVEDHLNQLDQASERPSGKTPQQLLAGLDQS